MEKDKTLGRLISNLSKHVLAHNFELAQKLINDGVPFSTGIVFQTLLKDDIKSFRFILQNNVQICESDILQVFTSNNKNTDKFKSTIIATIFKNKELEDTFQNKNKFFSQFKLELTSYLEDIDCLDVLKKENFSYDLNAPMEDILQTKQFINDFNAQIKGFYELKEFLPKYEIEEELELLSWKKLVSECEELYSSYMAERLSINEKIKPLVEQKDLINQNIQEIIQAHCKNENKITKGIHNP